MKRIIEFQVLKDKYTYIENGEPIFEVDRNERQLDVKMFYNAFFANGKGHHEIEIVPPSEIDKADRRIFDAISQLVENICIRLKTELVSELEKSDGEESIEPYMMR